jgi:4-amino-4-deoxy-L-arabinose transferase-like glycosyltransferase
MSWMRKQAPAPLVLLLGAVAILGVAWALVRAPWQAPDETWHFEYAQSVAERGALPGDESRPSASSEQELADQASRAGAIAFHLSVKPPWDEASFARWERADAALPDAARSDGGGPNNAASNPPGYYLYEAIPQKALWFGDVFDRLFAMQVWSVLLLLVSVAATWLLAGELFGLNRLLQLAAAAIVGLQPMATFMSSSVNPDGMLMALWALTMWVGVRVLRKGLTLRSGAVLAGLAAATALTKATGFIVVAGAAGVILYALWRQRRFGARRLLRTAAVCAAVAVIPLGGWLVAARLSDRAAINQVSSTSGQTISPLDFPSDYFASYLWQFYLPKLGFMQDVRVDSDYGYDVWFRTGWGVFGWKEVRLPETVYSWLRWVSYAVLIAAGVALVRRKVRLSAPVAAFLGLTGLALVLAMHWIEFRFIVERGGELFIQGRYFLPILPLAACAGAAALTLVPGRFRGAVAGAGLAGLIGLQVLALGTVLERYYA